MQWLRGRNRGSGRGALAVLRPSQQARATKSGRCGRRAGYEEPARCTGRARWLTRMSLRTVRGSARDYARINPFGSGCPFSSSTHTDASHKDRDPEKTQGDKHG